MVHRSAGVDTTANGVKLGVHLNRCIAGSFTVPPICLRLGDDNFQCKGAERHPPLPYFLIHFRVQFGPLT